MKPDEKRRQMSALPEIEALRRDIAAMHADIRARRPLGSVMSLEDVCQLLGCKRSRVFELLRAGKLERAPRMGRLLRITAASVERLLLTPAPAPVRQRRKRPPPPFVPARLENIPI